MQPSSETRGSGANRLGPVASLPADSRLQEVSERVQELDPWTLDRQMELTAIPAPPFGEGPRGERMAELFREMGLVGIRTDKAGNVLGEMPHGRSPGATHPLILSAHLDTVFPPGTDTHPRRDGKTIRAPGIADDGRGLAALLTLARVLTESTLPLPSPLLFAATVGEEGMGNLRGVRHLFSEEGAGFGAQGFISLDGVGLDRIIIRGVGSTRLHITAHGPGGHSWTDWGTPNPIHALGRAVAEAQSMALPTEPKTTLTVARWGGGTSINAIPERAWVEVDLRSEDPEVLERVEEGFLDCCRKSVAGGDGVAPSRRLTLDIEELGRRPAGSTDPGSPLVHAAVEATRTLGPEPLITSSSTDANLPMSLGIPAITMGAGGTAGGIHTLDEWYRNERGPEGILRALYTLLLLA